MKYPDPYRVPSPCYVLDDGKLKANMGILDDVQRRTGARILLALKCFAMWDVFPLLSRAKNGPLYGCCVSSPYEGRLAAEDFGGEVHAFAAGYSREDVESLLTVSDHIVFNSFGQWKRFRPLVFAQNKRREKQVQCGIRVNPEHSEGAVPKYNPCAPGSRLGVRLAQFEENELEGISGLHFHTLNQQGSEPLARTLDAFEEKFGRFLQKMKWVNLGGGHHITREDYNIDLLCECINRLRNRYGVDVYLEPGEAIALNAGVLVTTVLDVIQADMPIAILDISAAAHMPEVLEMPYRPDVVGAGKAGEKPYLYRLGGKSCLNGDVIGEYSFDHQLEVGERIMFTDMVIYTMVRSTTFNGIRLPSIARWDADKDNYRIIREFTYEDFKNRLS